MNSSFPAQLGICVPFSFNNGIEFIFYFRINFRDGDKPGQFMKVLLRHHIRKAQFLEIFLKQWCQKIVTYLRSWAPRGAFAESFHCLPDFVN